MLNLLGESHVLTELRIVLELEVSDAADHLEQLDQLQHFILAHVLLLKHHTHLAHAIAEGSFLFSDATLGVSDHKVHGVCHRHELLTRLLVVVVDLFDTF